MNYVIKIEKDALKFIKKQSPKQMERILKAIYKLPQGDVKQMKGYENRFRLRVGDYRVIYKMINNELIILILIIGNRGEVYKWIILLS